MTLGKKVMRVPMMRGGITGIEPDGLFELALCAGQVPIVRETHVSQGRVAFSEAVVQLHSFEGSFLGFGHGLARAQHVISYRTQQSVRVGESGKSRCVGWVFRNCTLKVL